MTSVHTHSAAQSVTADSPRRARNWVIPVGAGVIVSLIGLLISWLAGLFTPTAHHYETTGSLTHTWSVYRTGGGEPGESIPTRTTVQVECKVRGLTLSSDGNPWWYRISEPPWNGRFYASADAFYNNGQTTGRLNNGVLVDGDVPNCEPAEPT